MRIIGAYVPPARDIIFKCKDRDRQRMRERESEWSVSNMAVGGLINYRHILDEARDEAKHERGGT